MKKSNYNYEVTYKNKHLIYNCIHSSCVLLNNEEYNQYKTLQCDTKTQKELHELGILIDDNCDELESLFFYSKLSAYNDRNQYYRIYTTMACNAKCPYCYEKGTKIISMSESTADKVVEFITKRMTDNSRLTIEWFGGEPLLNKKIISYITNKIKPICKEKNVKYISLIVTNGLLFDKETVEQACKEWDLVKVQITIDGLKETYEKIKGFNQKNAFETLLQNIKMLTEKNIKVVIRLNYDENNFYEILKLIEYLSGYFPNKTKISIYSKKIMHNETDNTLPASEDFEIAILKQILKHGFIDDILKTIPRRNNSCTANLVNSFMITPDGKIGKCSQAMNDGDYVGSVFDGVETEKMVKWCTPKLPSRCVKCKSLPLCFGGCFYEKFKDKNYCFASRKYNLFKLKYFLKTMDQTKP